MFVREELRLPVSFPAAQARLASLADRGILLSAAQQAADDVTTGRARVGPVGPIPGLSRVVQVRFQDLIARGDSAQLALRWEAAGPGGALFPALDADITLTRAGDRATSMTIAGVYRPPLAGLGASLDQVILHRVATATIRDFLSRVADAIAVPQTSAERRRAAWYGPLPEPGPAAEPGGAC
jgi:hypothetical protein